jgi:hypothetical protein
MVPAPPIEGGVCGCFCKVCGLFISSEPFFNAGNDKTETGTQFEVFIIDLVPIGTCTTSIAVCNEYIDIWGDGYTGFLVRLSVQRLIAMHKST